LVAAVLVTTSGSIVWVTAGIASDGPALAFAIGAVAVSFGYAQEPGSGRAVAAGALLGAAVVAKALAAPAGLAVALLLLSRRRPRDLVYAAGAAAVVAIGAALPWGLGRVWDQSVSYNRNASRLTSYWGAVTKAWHTLVDRDPIVLVAVGLALGMLLLARLGWGRAPHRPPPTPGPGLVRPAPLLPLWPAGPVCVVRVRPPVLRPPRRLSDRAAGIARRPATAAAGRPRRRSDRGRAVVLDQHAFDALARPVHRGRARRRGRPPRPSFRRACDQRRARLSVACRPAHRPVLRRLVGQTHRAGADHGSQARTGGRDPRRVRRTGAALALRRPRPRTAARRRRLRSQGPIRRAACPLCETRLPVRRVMTLMRVAALRVGRAGRRHAAAGRAR